jgi:hypothetical protein
MKLKGAIIKSDGSWMGAQLEFAYTDTIFLAGTNPNWRLKNMQILSIAAHCIFYVEQYTLSRSSS